MERATPPARPRGRAVAPPDKVRAGIHVRNPRRGPWLVAALRWIVVFGASAGLASAGAVVALFLYAAVSTPRVPPFVDLRPGGMSTLTSLHGHVVAEVYTERRLATSFEDVPVGLIYALVAAEDERFFEHAGFDWRGIARAVRSNILAGEVVEGASTLTQLVAKSVLGRPADFSHNRLRAFVHKARELVFARRLEQTLSKEEILLLFLERVYWGNRAYGVRAAALSYFGRDLSDLSLTEMAILAGLPQSPSRYNPCRHPERARRRMQHVLRQMVRNGFITEEARAAAADAPFWACAAPDAFGEGAPYFARAALSEAERRAPAAFVPGPQGPPVLRVETSLDLAWQRAAERELARGLHDLDRKQGYRGPIANLPPDARAALYERNERWAARWAARRLAALGHPSASTAETAPSGFANAAALLGAEHARHGAFAGAVWPAVVVEVSAEGLVVAVTATVTARIDAKSLRWAGPYATAKRPSFEPKLTDPSSAFRPGDVVLVEITTGPGATADAAPSYRAVLAQWPRVQGALVAADADTHHVRALQGGYDWDLTEVNRAFSLRQTGSAIKPAFYSLAYELGLVPSAVLSGAPFREGDYAPTKGSGQGDLMVWDALAESENNVSLRIMNYVQSRAGRDGIARWFERLGLSGKVTGFTAEVLGVDQTPFGVLRMMATFANGGPSAAPTLVRRVTRADGRVFLRPLRPTDVASGPLDTLDALVRHSATPMAPAIPAPTAYLMAKNLADVFQRGTARAERRKLRLPAAGKTGTLPYDVWFAGFTRHAVATVWVGDDTRARILGAGRGRSRVYGANTALPVWREFMNSALRDWPSEAPGPAMPPEIVEVTVDPRSGRPASGRDSRRVPHLRGTEPPPDGPGSGLPDNADVLQDSF